MKPKTQSLQAFEFWYPAHNRLDLPIEWVPGQLVVQSINDCRIIPIDDFFAQPLLRYGQTVVSGIDLDNERKPRTIYREAASDGELPQLRLVLINSEEDDDPEPISELYEQTVDDRLRMIELAREFFVPQGLKIAVQLV